MVADLEKRPRGDGAVFRSCNCLQVGSIVVTVILEEARSFVPSDAAPVDVVMLVLAASEAVVHLTITCAGDS